MVCTHGAVYSASFSRIVGSIMEDIDTLSDHEYTGRQHSQMQKKALKRINKALSRISPDREKALQQIVDRWHGQATASILIGETRLAKWCYKQATKVQDYLQASDTQESYKRILKLRDLETRQGLVLYLAKRVPCDCLNDLKKVVKDEVKNGGKTGLCDYCAKESLAADQFVCGACGIQVYCSEACQRKHWASTKRFCHAWTKLRRAAEAEEEEEHEEEAEEDEEEKEAE